MTHFTISQRDAILRQDPLAFAQAAFNILEPDRTFEPSWHHEAITEVLQNSNGKRTRQYINAPPRSLKSFLVSVAWVAFKLGHEPTHKFICASYSANLANHHAAQCRRLMQSNLYTSLFSTRLSKITEMSWSPPAAAFGLPPRLGRQLPVWVAIR